MRMVHKVETVCGETTANIVLKRLHDRLCVVVDIQYKFDRDNNEMFMIHYKEREVK